jgi:hypothetical protein
MENKQFDLILEEQRKRASLNSVLLPEKYSYIKSIIDGGAKRVRTIRPYYFWSPTISVSVVSSTLTYLYHTLTQDTSGVLVTQATLANIPTGFLYYGNLYYQVQPPSAQAAAYQVNIGVTSYQKDGAVRAQQFQRLDAFDDGYNTYPTHTGTLAAAINGWTKPNNVYERSEILFHCFALQVNSNATGSVTFNLQVKFSGYQIETTDA